MCSSSVTPVHVRETSSSEIDSGLPCRVQLTPAPPPEGADEPYAAHTHEGHTGLAESFCAFASEADADASFGTAEIGPWNVDTDRVSTSSRR